MRQLPKTVSCTKQFWHYLIYISFSLFLENTLGSEIQTPTDETVDATCNEEEVGQATAQSMIYQGKEKKTSKT